MNIPENLKYTKSHEWLTVINKDEAKIGITDFAQKEITDIVHVELPEINKVVNKGDSIAILESVKSAFDIYSPVSGIIVSINERIINFPEIINKSPYNDGYLFVIKFIKNNEFNELLTAKDYKELI